MLGPCFYHQASVTLLDVKGSMAETFGGSFALLLPMPKSAVQRWSPKGFINYLGSRRPKPRPYKRARHQECGRYGSHRDTVAPDEFACPIPDRRPTSNSFIIEMSLQIFTECLG